MDSSMRILVVEDERIVAEDIIGSLERLGFSNTVVVSSGEKALEESEKTVPELVLMDIVLEGEMSGIEAAGIIREKFDIPVIYLTAYADRSILEKAKLTRLRSFGLTRVC